MLVVGSATVPFLLFKKNIKKTVIRLCQTTCWFRHNPHSPSFCSARSARFTNHEPTSGPQSYKKMNQQISAPCFLFFLLHVFYVFYYIYKKKIYLAIYLAWATQLPHSYRTLFHRTLFHRTLFHAAGFIFLKVNQQRCARPSGRPLKIHCLLFSCFHHTVICHLAYTVSKKCL